MKNFKVKRYFVTSGYDTAIVQADSIEKAKELARQETLDNEGNFEYELNVMTNDVTYMYNVKEI